MNTRERIADAIEKRANFAALVNAAKGNMGATIGAGLGAAYGAYQGASGPEASIASTLLGAASGGIGGGLVGGAAQGIGRGLGVGGGGSVFSQIARTRKAAAESAQKALGSDARSGFLANTRNIRAARRADAGYNEVTQRMANIDDLAQRGMMRPSEAKSSIDALAKANPYHAYEAAKKKLIYGTLGAGIAGMTGKGLISGAGAGAADQSDAIRETLQDKYNRTGHLDPREMALLRSKLTGQPT